MGGKFKLGETQTHLSKKLLRDHPNEEAQGAKENIPGVLSHAFGAFVTSLPKSDSYEWKKAL